MLGFIISEQDNHNISVFESFKEFIFPKRVSEGIEINPLFKNLFELIDANQSATIYQYDFIENYWEHLKFSFISMKTSVAYFVFKVKIKRCPAAFAAFDKL